MVITAGAVDISLVGLIEGAPAVWSSASLGYGALAAFVCLGALCLWFAAVNRRLRIAAAAAIHRSQRVVELLDSCAVPIWSVDGTLTQVLANRVMQHLQANGAMGPESAAALQAVGLVDRVAKSGVAMSESCQTIVDGQPKTLSLTATPLSSGGVGVFALDETGLESVQAELGRNVAASREVLEALATAIAIYGPDRRLRFYNAAFAALWPLDAGWLDTEPTITEVIETLREKRLLPEYADFPAFKRSQVKMFESLIEKREELLHLPDETTLRMVVTAHPEGGLMFAYENVTDTLALERSYNTLIEVQRETLDNLHEGIAVFGADGRCKLFNPAFLRLWGFSSEQLATDARLETLLFQVREFFPEVGDWPSVTGRISAALARRSPFAGVVLRADRRHVAYSTVPLPDGAMLCSFVDMTDREQVERALRERNVALEAADRLKTEFIANMSYELRTPLNTIIGFSELLTNQFFGGLTPRQLEYCQGVLESSQRLMGLINDILDLATIEGGYMELERVDIDLHALLASVLSLTRERAKQQHIALFFDCPPSIGVIEGDARRLKQAIFNLMTNACTFILPGGRVSLAAERVGDEVRISVSDTGTGIAEADQGRVFGRFERGSGRNRQTGAGLGLSLVKSIIELHGGGIELSSQLGKGTVVTCRLPVRLPPAQAA